MICITGDIHHSMGNNPEQKHSPFSESQLARKCADIFQDNDLKNTFFITGQAFHDDWEIIKQLHRISSVELGGHTFSALQPEYLHMLFKLTTGSYYGPAWYQQHDIKRTIDIITKKTGKQITSWRTHAFLSDATTFKILKSLLCSKSLFIFVNKNDFIFLDIYKFSIKEHFTKSQLMNV